MLGRRAYERNPVMPENLREMRVLRKKSVARMDSVRARDLARRENRRNIEITLLRRRRPDADALIGEAHMHRLLVRRRVDRDRGDSHLFARAVDSERDLAAIGDKDFFKHRPPAPPYDKTTSGSPNSTGSPSETRILRTLPPWRRGDVIHRLHRLDDEKRLPGLHLHADFYERLGVRLRREIDGSDHRRRHGVFGRLVRRLLGGRRGALLLHGRRRCRRDNGRARARDARAQALMLYLYFAETRFVQERGQVAHHLFDARCGGSFLLFLLFFAHASAFRRSASASSANA